MDVVGSPSMESDTTRAAGGLLRGVIASAVPVCAESASTAAGGSIKPCVLMVYGMAGGGWDRYRDNLPRLKYADVANFTGRWQRRRDRFGTRLAYLSKWTQAAVLTAARSRVRSQSVLQQQFAPSTGATTTPPAVCLPAPIRLGQFVGGVRLFSSVGGDVATAIRRAKSVSHRGR
jgi:hypothetical protein